MNVFTKLKWEIRIFLLIILAIVGFFIYGRVREVQSIDLIEAEAQASIESKEKLGEIFEVMTGIQIELSRGNCIASAQGDTEEIAICN